MSAAALARGVWPILPTPFAGPGLAVDHASLRRVVEHERAIGATGVVALGVLGEAERLTTAERTAVLATAVAAAESLPVVAGVSALATVPAVEEALRAADGGAAAVMLRVPTGDAGRLAAHVAAVVEATALPVVVQDHPATTQIRIAPAALVAALLELGDRVAAVKAEAPPTPATVAAVSAATEVPVFGGLGGTNLLDELLAGAAGAMTGFAVPEALVATLAAWDAGGYDAALRALAPVLALVLTEVQADVSLAVRKELLRRRGLLAEAGVRPPGLPLPPWAADALGVHLDAAIAAGAVPPSPVAAGVA